MAIILPGLGGFVEGKRQPRGPIATEERGTEGRRRGRPSGEKGAALVYRAWSQRLKSRRLCFLLIRPSVLKRGSRHWRGSKMGEGASGHLQALRLCVRVGGRAQVQPGARDHVFSCAAEQTLLAGFSVCGGLRGWQGNLTAALYTLAVILPRD